MSVVKNQRHESPVQFLETARDFYVMLIKLCENLPKRHFHYIQEPLIKTSQTMLSSVKMGNSIFPRNRHEAQLRRDYFLKGYASLQACVSYIGIAQEMNLFTPSQVFRLSELASEELRLIKGALESDTRRYKNLQD